MQPPPASSEPLSPAKRLLQKPDFLLLCIVLAAAVPCLWLGATQFIEYDGYWHIFTAQQDRWQNFAWDCQNLAHPPLYYLVLRYMLWLGKSHLAYRAISLLAALASIAVLGRLARRMMRWTLTPPMAALAYGLALPTIILSCEVRAYAMCIVLVLLAYSFYLEMLEGAGPEAPLRPRVLFAVTAALACATEYYAPFFVCSVFAVSVVVPIFRRREPLWRAWAREVKTFAPSYAVVVWLYFVWRGNRGLLQNHLLPYYYDPAGDESLGEFLLRNLQNTFNLFSPYPAAGRTVFLATAGCLLLAVVAALWVLRRIWAPKNLAAAATVIVTTMMVVQLAVAAVIRVYPFGGFLRQQSILFPFLVLSAFVLPDRLLAASPRRAAYALAALLSVALVAVSYRAFAAHPKVRQALMTEQMERFNRLFPAPPAVYVDQFNLVAFFLHHDHWKWEFDGRLPGVEIYRVSRGTEQMLVLRDKATWNLDCRDVTLWERLAECLRARGLSRIDLFRLGQSAEPWEAAELRDYKKSISDLARKNGLCVQAMVIHDRDVYAEIRPGGCSAPAQP